MSGGVILPGSQVVARDRVWTVAEAQDDILRLVDGEDETSVSTLVEPVMSVEGWVPPKGSTAEETLESLRVTLRRFFREDWSKVGDKIVFTGSDRWAYMEFAAGWFGEMLLRALEESGASREVEMAAAIHDVFET